MKCPKCCPWGKLSPADREAVELAAKREGRTPQGVLRRLIRMAYSTQKVGR